MPPSSRLAATLLSIVLLALPSACGRDDTAARDLHLAREGRVALAVVVPAGAGIGLQGAAQDVVEGAAAITGAELPADAVTTDPTAPEPRVVVEISATFEGAAQAYALSVDGATVRINAATETGAMYGLYAVAADMGVRYHHPEETWYAHDPDARLPAHYDGLLDSPDFEWRGFHEHTQHPLPMSDFLLRPEADFREYVSNYIRWLARNRQNTMSWQMLKTVDLNAWLPYAADVVEEAHEWGVRIGMVVSFVDQQQNMYRLIREEDLDGDGDDEAHLRASLGELVDVGFDFLVTQIGSSEFTKPDDEDVLRWIGIAADVLDDAGVAYWTWIHTTCDLEADDGSRFYHLPLQAGATVGAWLHTTMFYNLRDPAPVYGCEDFSHQREFADEATGDRSLVYFPETAWWLGFDSNLPLALPVTGRSREADIREILPAWDVDGHVTFTSGREWAYWQYDHFLTRATWDREFGWEDYLAWIAPMYGEQGDDVVAALSAWTDLEWQHFLVDDPLIYFYVAGELRQDEIGARAGILARRPKLAFSDVVAMDDEAYAGWQDSDLAMLRRMRREYGAVFDPLAAPGGASATLGDTLYAELYDTLYVFVRRLDHTITLYEALDPVRAWAKSDAEAADDALRDSLLSDAEAALADARAISQDVLERLTDAEDRYRFPVGILARPKPESPTAYPFGYLEQTSSAHFWVRRDNQLDALIGRVFGTAQDEWAREPDSLYISDADHTTLVTPDDPLAGSVITGFVPQTLFGFADDIPSGDVTVALDFNQNLLPDPGSETSFAMSPTGSGLSGTADVFTLTVYTATGEAAGEVNVLDAELDVVIESGAPTTVDLAGAMPSDEMVGLVVSVGGIDTAGATNLVKSVFGFAPDEEMTATLPIRFRFEVRTAD